MTPEPMAEVTEAKSEVMPAMEVIPPTPLVMSEMKESTWALATVAPTAATKKVE